MVVQHSGERAFYISVVLARERMCTRYGTASVLLLRRRTLDGVLLGASLLRFISRALVCITGCVSL